MTKIEKGQLVRITGFHKKDALYGIRTSFIGLTGRFVEYTIPIMKGIQSPKSYMDGTWSGQFQFEPDFLGDNSHPPVFSYVYVEPVEAQNEK